MTDEYRPRPILQPVRNEMRERLLAVPDGQALVLRDELERRKAVHAFGGAAAKKEWRVCTRSQPDGTFIVWVEKRPQP